jgi:hypothetical protein
MSGHNEGGSPAETPLISALRILHSAFGIRHSADARPGCAGKENGAPRRAVPVPVFLCGYFSST